MTNLRQAAQQALEALELSAVTVDSFGVQKATQEAITALRTALEQQQAEPPEWLLIKNILDEYGLRAISFVAEWKAAQQQAEPVSHAVIVGALFDFMGWLTTRKERLILSSTDNASPAADAIKVFAEMRGLSLDDALVQDWQNYTTPPQQQAEPVTWLHPANSTCVTTDPTAYSRGIPLYTTPPQQQAEPVAWMDREGDLYKMPEIKNWAPPHTMLYTAPPQRKWQGLTDEQLDDIAVVARRGNLHDLRITIEAKLKEKND